MHRICWFIAVVVLVLSTAASASAAPVSELRAQARADLREMGVAQKDAALRAELVEAYVKKARGAALRRLRYASFQQHREWAVSNAYVYCIYQVENPGPCVGFGWDYYSLWYPGWEGIIAQHVIYWRNDRGGNVWTCRRAIYTIHVSEWQAPASPLTLAPAGILQPYQIACRSWG